MRFVHHVGQTSIAVGRAGFALVHVLVDFTFVLVPNQSFPVPQHGGDLVVNAAAFFDQTATHDGARIDQWVVGDGHACAVGCGWWWWGEEGQHRTNHNRHAQVAAVAAGAAVAAVTAAASLHTPAEQTTNTNARQEQRAILCYLSRPPLFGGPRPFH